MRGMVILWFVAASTVVAGSAAAQWSVTGVQDSEFAAGLAAAGDLDGDGFDEVMVGAHAHLNAGVRGGVVYVFRGGPSGPEGMTPSDAWWTLTGTPTAVVGRTIGAAGDLNGDGYDDIFVGREGQAIDVFLGSPTGPGASPDWSLTGGTFVAAAAARDTNGDGFGDLIVGETFRKQHGGAVHVFLGGPSGPSVGLASAVWSIREAGGGLERALGWTVAGVGDVDADGFDDILVGGTYGLGMNSPPGLARVYRGGPSGPVGTLATPHWSAEGSPGISGFSTEATGGDFNGDGYADVAVAAPAYGSDLKQRREGEGRLHVWYGSAAGLVQGPADLTLAGAAEAALGRGLSAADVNGDGAADLLVGAYGTSGFVGESSLFLGAPAGLAVTPHVTYPGDVAGRVFGLTSGLPDTNGDGHPELLVGGRGGTGLAALYAPFGAPAPGAAGGTGGSTLASTPPAPTPAPAAPPTPAPPPPAPRGTAATPTSVGTVAAAARSASPAEEPAEVVVLTATPRIVAPKTGARVSPRPTFEIEEIDGAEIPNAKARLIYELQVDATGMGFNAPEHDASLRHTGSGAVSWSVPEDLAGGRYTARVRAVLDGVAETPWSQIRFTVK